MGAVLASKNSFCEPENGELPVLDTSSNILEEDDLLALRDRLPTRLENHPWTLAFSTTRDGFSLSQLYRKLHEVDSVVLLVIQVLFKRRDPGKVCFASGCRPSNIRRPPLRAASSHRLFHWWRLILKDNGQHFDSVRIFYVHDFCAWEPTWKTCEWMD